MVHVPHIQLDPLHPWQSVPAVHLRPAGDPWLHLETTPLDRSVPGNLVLERGPRTDETHLPPEHIQQLRKLVQAPGPQKSTDARDAVVISSDRGAQTLVNCSLDHGPKLVDLN